MSHENTWESNGLYRKFTGSLTAEDILDANIDLWIDPHFNSIEYLINDFSSITGHSILVKDTRVYAFMDDILSETKEQLKIALVVNNNKGSLLPLANHYCEEMKDKLFECDTFLNIEDARKWVAA